MTREEFIEKMTGEGWRLQTMEYASYDYLWRPADRSLPRTDWCLVNGYKAQPALLVHHEPSATLNGLHWWRPSVDVQIVGCILKDQWIDFRVYNLRLDEFLEDQEGYLSRHAAAWHAMCVALRPDGPLEDPE